MAVIETQKENDCLHKYITTGEKGYCKISVLFIFVDTLTPGVIYANLDPYNLVYKQETNSSYAIGLKDADAEGLWEWQHTGEFLYLLLNHEVKIQGWILINKKGIITLLLLVDGVARFQHWGPGEPSGGMVKNCAVMNMGPSDAIRPPGFWRAEECNGSTKFQAICEEINI